MKNKKGQESIGAGELKQILVVVAIIIVLGLLIYLWLRSGQTLLGQNATRVLFRR